MCQHKCTPVSGLRKVAEHSIEGLWSAIGRLADAITPTGCANHFAAA